MPSVKTTGARKKSATRFAAGPMKKSAVALPRHQATRRLSRWPVRAPVAGRSTTVIRAPSRLLDDELVLELGLQLVHANVGGLLRLHLPRLHRPQQPPDDLVIGAEL